MESNIIIAYRKIQISMIVISFIIKNASKEIMESNIIA